MIIDAGLCGDDWVTLRRRGFGTENNGGSDGHHYRRQ